MRRLALTLLAALLILGGCGSPTDTLSAKQVHKMPNYMALDMVDCQLDLVQEMSYGERTSFARGFFAPEYRADLRHLAALGTEDEEER